ncbi:metallophosphoesterase family protein [Runella limosa]|uniref:metallophosphoesterase family protein n=1 Tax=Runella limosa TaxID=370978 RepID=UPI0004046959|nr:metallophosphoesterase [Runella limosa]
MNRRNILKSGIAFVGAAGLKNSNVVAEQNRGSFALDGNVIRFYHPAIKERFNITMLADTHLFKDDERGVPFQQFSGRMAKAYNQTIHFQTGAATNPEESFRKTLEIAKQDQSKLVALIGDIFSFPSEAAVEWVASQLKEAQLPHLYVTGNHDWHYEGMEGSSHSLRDTWTQKRLRPMYQNDHPLMTVREINGVRFLALDNSTYQITPEQLAFFRKEATTQQPLVLMVHIPLYAPERSLGFGCGHPKWNAQNDKNYQLERRERWPETGHSQTTMQFHKEVFSCPNLLGILAGHTHKPTLDVVNGIPQVITPPNATGGYLKVEGIPTL